MITIYGIPNCPHCKDLMRKLDEAGERFTYIDVTQDEGAFAKMKALNVMSFPYTEED